MQFHKSRLNGTLVIITKYVVDLAWSSCCNLNISPSRYLIWHRKREKIHLIYMKPVCLIYTQKKYSILLLFIFYCLYTERSDSPIVKMIASSPQTINFLHTCVKSSLIIPCRVENFSNPPCIFSLWSAIHLLRLLNDYWIMSYISTL